MNLTKKLNQDHEREFTSRLSQGELTEGVFVGRGCGVDEVDDGDKGGVNIPLVTLDD